MAGKSELSQQSEFLGSGWQFPPTFSSVSHQLAMNQSEANINQSIDLILQTRRGERCLLPDFGSQLNTFLFRSQDASLQEEIAKSVRNTLLNDEPRISVDEVFVSFTSEEASQVVISVLYTIKQTNTRHNHVFPFSLLEGTNLAVKV
ncbi:MULTISPECIES: GPW/gp25 family protein [unclassified Pseudoalteromonas]|uniref:GPW/gp25 family protein n=1 Tax=unclassified Pseudoalteromonas TaxID=194690 RepID=UPI002096D134|nr:GPW/gp25 family protein [Pseudoalteromonas sp. XMcav2-N]MCO7188541.1 GPW/gp25 family protein [Pseudoalteromonas sp. XMcav2-N]